MNVYLNRTILYERSEIWGGQLGEHRRIYEAFLASDKATYLNGVIIPLDGGWSCTMA